MASNVGNNNKHSAVRHCFDKVPRLFETIRQETRSFQNQKWSLPKDRQLLENLAGKVGEVQK